MPPPVDKPTTETAAQKKRLAAEWRQKLQEHRRQSKWSSGPLTESWDRPKGARSLDYMEDGEMDWMKKVRPKVSSRMMALSKRAKKKVAERDGGGSFNGARTASALHSESESAGSRKLPI